MQRLSTPNDGLAGKHEANALRVHACNVEKGWFDKPVDFLAAMMLLVTEIDEANDAMEEEGLAGGWKAREHTQSEFADIYIRFLDDCVRFGIDFPRVTQVYGTSFVFGPAGSQDGAFRQLGRRVTAIAEAYREHGLNSGFAVSGAFAHFYLQLRRTADIYGVDLAAAFDRKMAVNEARPYRHGGKHA